ncbi:replicative DNA helicase, partial [bacterium]|nr:replicative DNA helicase [bacterium]
LESIPTAANVAFHAKIVKEKSLLRRLIGTATEIVTTCYESDKDVDEIVDLAETKIYDVSQKKDVKSVIHLRDQVHESFAELERIYEQQGSVSGLPSGFKDLDFITAGFKNSEMTIIAARPSMGKTAFATAIMEHVAIHEGKGVLFFSVEMSKENLVQRLLCSYGRANISELRKGYLSETGWVKLTEAASIFANTNIFIDDTPGISILEMKNKARRLKAQNKIDIVIIDYLQLLSVSKKVESRQQEISEISRALKGMARELKIPVIALSQLSRAVEARSDHKPMLSDLRESGAIEQDADLVLMLMREEYYNATEENRNKAKVIVGKNRNGPTGELDLVFIKEFTRFESFSRQREEVGV